MARQSNEDVSKIGVGLHTNNSPIDQPQGTYRFALNAVEETNDGNQRKLSNEPSSYNCTNLPTGYVVIGDRYLENNTTFLILSKLDSTRIDMGLLDRNSQYKTLVNTGVLNMPVTHQCDIQYRLRRGNERVVYWVNGYNQAKTLNIDRLHNFQNTTYANYIRGGGNPDTFVGEKWDGSSFDLIKTYSSIPTFNNVEVLENGNILPGSFNFAIQLVDEDLNPTEWITTSNTVNIYNDSINNPFERIRGSRNVSSDSQSFPRTNKSIKLTISGLDKSFPYFRVGIIQATSGTGEPTKVLASELNPTSDSTYTYTGNDESLTSLNIGDILIDDQIIFAPRHIEQIENRLILMYGEGKGINWCNFQRYASKINSDLVTKQVVLNNVASETNIKNGKSTFMYRGYMPGEVQSFGVVYVFNDGYISPSFHIPGKNIKSTSKLKYYELDTNYLDIHNCSAENYWGLDGMGETLVGKPIRHHRFPFRKEVNKPLVSSNGTTTNLIKYRLKLQVGLNPAWTPGPIEYPKDSGGLPLAINYTIQYKVTGSGTNNTFSGQLVDTDVSLSKPITVYDDTISLDTIVGTEYGELTTDSQLYTYQTLANERFILTYTYEQYTVSSSFNNDVAEIFGIEFSNIEKPHPDVIGFYIVRNERTDDDRLILDNAIFGQMTEFQQYKSFGVITPRQTYGVNNCGVGGNPNKSIKFYDKSLWFFNPEFQYLQKKIEYDGIEVEGVYEPTTIDMPSISSRDNYTCNGDGSKGVYVQDVQAGTSFNPEVNKAKNKDDDGFDLIIGYRNTNVKFVLDSTITMPVKSRILYFNAASYQNFAGNVYYNVSTDNKIGMYLTDTVIDLSKIRNNTTNKTGFFYGALTKTNPSAYANFLSRPYYKEHNNPVLFGNTNIVNKVAIYNGDAEISAFNFVSTVFYDMAVADRPKKSSIWKIVTGALLVVGAIIATVATGGIAAPLVVVAASSLAISYGVTMLMSGIKFEQFKAMIETDYEKGLKETILDGGVFETVGDFVLRQDDTIKWFSDRVSNIYMESSVPFGLRSGLTSGTPDFVDAPAAYNEGSFRSYLIEKLTTLDRNQGSGRLYKGYASAEVYDMNKDYMRFNKQKNFIHLPLEYDCCSDSKETYPTRRWFSQQSFQEEKTDNYRSFLPNNYSDIEGEHGAITDTFRLGNNLFIHTAEALWQQPVNIQERITGEIVSFIGTGEFMAIPPRKVLDSNLGSAGCQHKWATIKTPVGVFFVSEIEHKPYLFGESPRDISEGISNYFEENLRPFLSDQLYGKFGVTYMYENNPANIDGTGYISTYDTRYERIILTKRDHQVIPSRLASLELRSNKPTSGNAFIYCLKDGLFYDGVNPISLTNTLYFEDKGFTLSYSLKSKQWISWHSYLPNYYIYTQNDFYSFVNTANKIWKHNMVGNYQTHYGRYNPFIIEYVINSNILVEKTFEAMLLQTLARKWDGTTKQYIEDKFITFNKLTVFNSNQCTGELTIKVKQTEPSPSLWYSHQIVESANVVTANRSNSGWNLNRFRNYVNDYSKPMFTSGWNDIRDSYFIDKIVNSLVIDYKKPWHELESLKGKYVVIRLKFDIFDNTNLILDYSIQSEIPTV